MSASEGITLESVREFLVKNNGKVKNTDLVHHFRQQLNDPVNKGEFYETTSPSIHVLFSNSVALNLH